jgi:hypothetical protein
MISIEDPPEPLFVRHKIGQRALAIGESFYWSLVRDGKITVVGRGKTSRASWQSIKDYAAKLLAEAEAQKVA